MLISVFSLFFCWFRAIEGGWSHRAAIALQPEDGLTATLRRTVFRYFLLRYSNIQISRQFIALCVEVCVYFIKYAYHTHFAQAS